MGRKSRNRKSGSKGESQTEGSSSSSTTNSTANNGSHATTAPRKRAASPVPAPAPVVKDYSHGYDDMDDDLDRLFPSVGAVLLVTLLALLVGAGIAVLEGAIAVRREQAAKLAASERAAARAAQASSRPGWHIDQVFEDTENGGGDEESYQAVTHADAFACIPRAKPPRIVFNRVYKTGSVEFGAVLDVMSVANNFSVVRSRNYDFFATEKDALLRQAQATSIAYSNYSDTSWLVTDYKYKFDVHGHVAADRLGEDGRHPVMWDEHSAFSDFSKFGLLQPVYFNLVRDPLERFAFQFAHTSFFRNKKPDAWPCTAGKSLKECLAVQPLVANGTCEEKENCGYGNFMTHFFCGNGPPCSEAGSAEALRHALHNLQYSNDFVGVLEHLEKSYKVAEAVLPSVFKGASAVYPKKFKVLRSAESTPVPSFQSRRAYVQNQTLDKEEHTRLMDINRNDMELYRAARRLLARRASACRLATTKPLAAARIPRLDPRLPE